MVPANLAAESGGRVPGAPYNRVVQEIIEDAIKSAARALGFDLVGITSAEEIEDASRLAAWVAADQHGEMRFLAETLATRVTPGAFLPGAASVVCVAMSFANPRSDAPRGDDPPVRVAAYAARRDYHTVIRSRLIRLGRAISSWAPGASWRVAVDSAPVAEKALAARAGLGWIGANTLLLNRHHGSRLLLGELVTDVRLRPDSPVPSLCGECTACVSACPTRALAAPRRLDARRCIAYLTVEHRGAIPPDLAPCLGDHFFGCDCCQNACPWNHGGAAETNPALTTRTELLALRVGDLQELGHTGWRRLAGATPMRRLDASRFARNLETVLANRARIRPGSEISTFSQGLRKGGS